MVGKHSFSTHDFSIVFKEQVLKEVLDFDVSSPIVEFVSEPGLIVGCLAPLDGVD